MHLHKASLKRSTKKLLLEPKLISTTCHHSLTRILEGSGAVGQGFLVEARKRHLSSNFSLFWGSHPNHQTGLCWCMFKHQQPGNPTRMSCWNLAFSSLLMRTSFAGLTTHSKAWYPCDIATIVLWRCSHRTCLSVRWMWLDGYLSWSDFKSNCNMNKPGDGFLTPSWKNSRQIGSFPVYPPLSGKQAKFGTMT